MVDSEQHSRFSPEVNPKLGAKIINNRQCTINILHFTEYILCLFGFNS